MHWIDHIRDSPTPLQVFENKHRCIDFPCLSVKSFFWHKYGEDTYLVHIMQARVEEQVKSRFRVPIKSSAYDFTHHWYRDSNLPYNLEAAWEKL